VDESDAPVVKLVNLMIQEAISQRASDIHVEPFGDRVRIRYRIDGCWSSATQSRDAYMPPSPPA